MMAGGAWLFALLLAALALLLNRLYDTLWARPESIRRALRSQGIDGPRPSFFLGNIRDIKKIKQESGRRSASVAVSHDFASTLFPHFTRWSQQYGSTFIYSSGSMVILYVGDANLVKEVCLNKSLDLGKPSFSRKNYGALVGKGVVSSNGAEWVTQRKIIAPEFFMDKVKDMTDLMVESILSLLKSWEARVEHAGGIADLKVDEDFEVVAADVISRTCFGSSYTRGEKIFSKIKALQKSVSEMSSLVGIPGLRYMPLKKNREIWRLSKEIRCLVLKVVKERMESAGVEKDFLQSILQNSGNEHATDDFVVDNCKSLYFNGQETTATVAKWVLVLLASNPEWQARVRNEVIEVCGDHLPNWEMLRKMTLLTMVIQETLRLYPGTPMVVREAFCELMVGGLRIPKGTILWIPVLKLHHDPELWGPDANQFKPERFANGVSGSCKLPHAYVPFGVGQRTCLGQNFAMVELKIVLSLILSKFSVSISPSYRHFVAHRLVLSPEYGVDLLIRKI